MILIANPRAQYLAHKNDIDRAVLATFENGFYINGDEVQNFEQEFAAFIGTSYGVGLASGTDAIRIALGACEVKAGDEVITVSHTAVATVCAIEQAGGTPVLVDIDPKPFLMDIEQIKKAITPKTTAIVAVHLYGQSVDLNPIKEICEQHKLWLIEDCAQAHGAKYQGKTVGSIGDIAAFSFYPTKNLGAIGDGGAVVTNNEKLFNRCRLLREYGWSSRYISDIPGTNSRLDEVQAAILRVKLPHLNHDNDARRKIAAFYCESLHDLPITLPEVRSSNEHVYHLFVIRLPNRDQVLKHLQSHDIQAGIHYPVPIHLQPAYKGKIRTIGSMSETVRSSKEILSLPMYPELGIDKASEVVAALRSWSW